MSPSSTIHHKIPEVGIAASSTIHHIITEVGIGLSSTTRTNFQSWALLTVLKPTRGGHRPQFNNPPYYQWWAVRNTTQLLPYVGIGHSSANPIYYQSWAWPPVQQPPPTSEGGHRPHFNNPPCFLLMSYCTVFVKPRSWNVFTRQLLLYKMF